MKTAIYTVKTIKEMAAKLTEHPVRGVNTGDIMIVIGDRVADDTLSYTATVKPSPSTNGHLSIASDDGKVQWDLLTQSFGTGGIPRSLKHGPLLPSIAPDGWSHDSVTEAMGVNRIGVADYKGTPQLFKAGTLLVLTGGYSTIDVYDTEDNYSLTSYDIPALPDEDSAFDLSYYATVYCEYTGLIHFIGGHDSVYTHHHTFDPITGTFTTGAKSAPPINVYSDDFAYDCSDINNCFYVFTDSGEIRKYNAELDSWYAIANGPQTNDLSFFVREPGSNRFLAIDASGNGNWFYPATDTWDTGVVSGASVYSRGFNGYSEYHGLFFAGVYADLCFIDPYLGTTSLILDFFDDALLSSNGSCIDIGNSHYINASSENSESLWLFTIASDMYIKKD